MEWVHGAAVSQYLEKCVRRNVRLRLRSLILGTPISRLAAVNAHKTPIGRLAFPGLASRHLNSNLNTGIINGAGDEPSPKFLAVTIRYSLTRDCVIE